MGAVCQYMDLFVFFEQSLKQQAFGGKFIITEISVYQRVKVDGLGIVEYQTAAILSQHFTFPSVVSVNTNNIKIKFFAPLV